MRRQSRTRALVPSPYVWHARLAKSGIVLSTLPSSWPFHTISPSRFSHPPISSHPFLLSLSHIIIASSPYSASENDTRIPTSQEWHDAAKTATSNLPGCKGSRNKLSKEEQEGWLKVRPCPGHAYLRLRQAYVYVRMCVCMYVCIDSLIHALIHSCIHRFIDSLIHSSVHRFIRSFMHSFIHAFIHWCID